MKLAALFIFKPDFAQQIFLVSNLVTELFPLYDRLSFEHHQVSHIGLWSGIHVAKSENGNSTT
jgi:hypothetical protein